MDVSEWPALPCEDWREKRNTLNVYTVGVDNREAAVGSILGRCVHADRSRAVPYSNHGVERETRLELATLPFADSSSVRWCATPVT